MLSFHSCIFPKWACIPFMRIPFSRREMASTDKIGLYSKGRMPRRNCPRSAARPGISALLYSPAPRHAGRLWAEFMGGLWAVRRALACLLVSVGPGQCILCPKKPSVRRVGRGSCAEGGPRVLTGRFRRCRRHRRPPWQIPGAGHWSPGQCCGRCSRRQHPPGSPHTE